MVDINNLMSIRFQHGWFSGNQIGWSCLISDQHLEIAPFGLLLGWWSFAAKIVLRGQHTLINWYLYWFGLHVCCSKIWLRRWFVDWTSACSSFNRSTMFNIVQPRVCLPNAFCWWNGTPFKLTKKTTTTTPAPLVGLPPLPARAAAAPTTN